VPGFKKWYVLKRYTDHNRWASYLHLRFDLENGAWITVPDKNQATPFMLKEQAEVAAFNLTVKDPNLIGGLVVELL